MCNTCFKGLKVSGKIENKWTKKKSPPLRVRIKEYGTCYKKKWTVMLAAAIFLWVLACAAWQNICELKKKNLVKDQTLSKQDEYSDFTYWTFSIN